MASVSNLEAMKSHASIRNELRVSVVDETEIDPETVVRELQKFLIKKKTYGSPGSDGSFLSNLIALIQAEHEFISIFKGHELDPFSRTERLIFLFNSLSFLFMLAMLMNSADMDPVLKSFIIALFLTPYKYILRLLAECPCFYSTDSGCNVCFVDTVERIGGCLSFIFVLTSIIFIIAGALEASIDGIIEWSLSIAFSYLVTNNLELLFHMYWCYTKHKEQFETKWNSHFRDDDPPVSFTQIAELVKQKCHMPTSSKKYPHPGIDYTYKFDKWMGIDHLSTEKGIDMTSV